MKTGINAATPTSAVLPEIRSPKDSEVKERIDKFTLEKPESVAQLLRNWINKDSD